MKKWRFTEDDRRQMQALGITEAEVREQLRTFEKSSYFMRLHRPCTVGDGIHRITDSEVKAYCQIQEQAAKEGRCQKFVPASGAASRMFQDLCQYHYLYPSHRREEILAQAQAGDPVAQAFIPFLEGLRRFAFFADLQEIMARKGIDMESLLQGGRHAELVPYLLTEAGLNYGALPKGLLKFHHHPSGSRTAFEEHLAEAVHYIRDRLGVCRLHFTVSAEHHEAFAQLLEKVAPRYGQRYQTRFEVTFSVQDPATHTIAVDLENRPWRGEDGRLLFRPGGHGALLKNLNELKGDLVYIKNIDNVLPDRLKEPTVTWKKVLGGYLLDTQARVHHYLHKLGEGPEDPAFYGEVLAFAQERLLFPAPKGFQEWPLARQRDFLFARLHRPLRVCGMVRNEGEPGGAPFWVVGKDGAWSLQIVEGAQVNGNSPEQQAIWAAATHFNPVDLVCALQDHQGRPFDLTRYVDAEAVFISQKSSDGQELKALELPGLWNGAMSDWLTMFVEVPGITFNPVKTVFDLLRPQHQG